MIRCCFQPYRLNALLNNQRKCHSETRSLFEREEESAFFHALCEKQIPRFARDDKNVYALPRWGRALLDP
jgi:hypothetical protein